MGTTSRETNIGRIPEEWKVAPLGSLANITTGTKDVNEGNPDGEYPFFTCAKEHTYSDSFSFDCEALLVAGNASVGRTSYYSGKFEAYQRTYVLSAFDNVISHYLKYYLQKNLEFHLQSSVHKSAMSYIKLGYLKNFVVYLPPLPEQRKIAAILSTVDEAIEKTDAIIQKTQQLKRGLMQKLFAEGIGHTRFKETKVGRIPEEWEVVKMGDYCNFTTGKLNSNQATPDGVYPFFTCSQDTLFINRYSFDCEALLLSGNNAVGKYSVKHYIGRFDAYQRTYVITIKDKDSLSYIYLQNILEAKLEELRKYSIGTATQYLTLKLLLNLQVPKPPFFEQQSIAEILSEVDTEIETEQSYKAELEQLKKGIMQVLLTGKVRVKV